jgi:hypothetical protein
MKQPGSPRYDGAFIQLRNLIGEQQMVRFGVIACVALLVATADQALAQAVTKALPGPPAPAPMTAPTSLTGGIPPSVYSSANVGQFLVVCGSDQGGCADEVGNALINKMVFDGTANICLPGPDYAGAAIKWLGAHSETHNMPTEDGIYMALQKVYACA